MSRRPGSGGPRQGAPGVLYGNRTDLNAGPRQAPAANPTATAASASLTPPALSRVETPGPTPDQTTPLDAPTGRPGEPVTAGLPFGPGPGPAPSTTNADLLAMRRHLPWLLAASRADGTPLSVINFVQYLQSQVTQ